MKEITTYQLLTFYAFVDIQDAHEQVQLHKQFCNDIWMKWRVYIGEEWISSTVTGNLWQVQAYNLFLAANKYFKDIWDIDIKATQVDGHQFDKMIVRYRSEIVALWKMVTAKQVENADKQISVDELKRIIDEQDDDWAILDMRNDYERQLGHFKWAIPAGTVNFREVQDLIKKYKEKLKNKKVVMYCTWGIRCEKLSVLLKDEWVENFYGLEWGVVKYTNLHNDGNREGNLYTFDGRVSCQIGDEKTHTSIATCLYTDEHTDNCENCRYSPCNARIIATPKAYRKHYGFCSKACCDKWTEDLLIKNIDRDPIDFKSLRGLIKQDPTQKQAIKVHVAEVVRKKTLHAPFKHLTSQKERILYER
jgi:UPF0176 protein